MSRAEGESNLKNNLTNKSIIKNPFVFEFALLFSYFPCRNVGQTLITCALKEEWAS